MQELIHGTWDVWNWFKQNRPNSDVVINSGVLVKNKITVKIDGKTHCFERGDPVSLIKERCGVIACHTEKS